MQPLVRESSWVMVLEAVRRHLQQSPTSSDLQLSGDSAPLRTQHRLGIFFFKILFIHETHTHTEKQRHRHAPCMEPDAGLNPRTPGSRTEPKAQPLSDLVALRLGSFKVLSC